jgi:hypothetical protein
MDNCRDVDSRAVKAKEMEEIRYWESRTAANIQRHDMVKRFK